MAGHSKWSKIKRAKAVTDAKKGKVYTRFLREIQVAAKTGGDLSGNPRLKRVVDSAKSAGVPNDNIAKAIKRGTGDIEGEEYIEVAYEAYGPGGIGIIIKALTDNKNRTVGAVRHVLSKNGGSLASANAVAYQFDEKAVFIVPKELAEEDALMDKSLESGAEDVKDSDDMWEVIADVSEFDVVLKSLQELGEGITAEIQMLPQNVVMLEGEEADKLMALLDAIDDLDDVQNVFSNFDTE